MVSITQKELYSRALSAAPSAFEAGKIFEHITGSRPPDAGDAPVPDAQITRLDELLRRRVNGEPLQYLLGEWEFYSLPFRVGPGVLIPRQDTETLVDVALDMLKKSASPANSNPELLDLCSGSGCVAVAIKHEFPAARVTALEFSGDAYRYLTENITRSKLDITPVLSDMRDYTHPEKLDFIVSNPPYIPKEQLAGLQAEIGFEPLAALDGGEDGLRFFRAIARRYKEQLAPGGTVLLEIGAGQQSQVSGILAEHGYKGIAEHKDLTGTVRVLTAAKE